MQTLALLNKLLDGAHDSQVKAMESRQERECTELRKNQVKQSVETSKNAGKLIKCKEEKERYDWETTSIGVVASLMIGGGVIYLCSQTLFKKHCQQQCL